MIKWRESVAHSQVNAGLNCQLAAVSDYVGDLNVASLTVVSSTAVLHDGHQMNQQTAVTATQPIRLNQL